MPAAIGRATALQDKVSRRQISRKIAETWGERTTVERAIQRLFRTLIEWGILTPDGSSDTFAIAAVQTIYEPQLALWLAEAVLHAHGSAIPYASLIQAPEIFPFRLNLQISDLTRSGRFETFREGSELLIGVRLLAMV